VEGLAVSDLSGHVAEPWEDSKFAVSRSVGHDELTALLVIAPVPAQHRHGGTAGLKGSPRCQPGAASSSGRREKSSAPSCIT